VRIEGKIGTPTPCQTVNGRADRNGDVLELRVTARATGDPCVQEPGAFLYTAQISGLDVGGYRLRVVHQLPGTGSPGPRTVLDTTVTAR